MFNDYDHAEGLNQNTWSSGYCGGFWYSKSLCDVCIVTTRAKSTSLVKYNPGVGWGYISGDDCIKGQFIGVCTFGNRCESCIRFYKGSFASRPLGQNMGRVVYVHRVGFALKQARDL